MIKGLASIITPTYNSEKFIAETIESVINQTYKNWELIIVNDCSTDNTKNILNNFEDERIKLIDMETNGGAPNAWNEAFKIMRGEYVAFLDSDDVWVANKLEKQIEFMKNNQYIFTYTSYDWIDEDSINLGKVIYSSKSKNFSQAMSNTNIGLLTVMIDRKGFNDFKVANIPLIWDLYLWAKVLSRGIIAYGITDVLAHYRIVSNSASRNKMKHSKGVWNLYYKHLNLPIYKCILYFTSYVFNSIRRYYLNK